MNPRCFIVAVTAILSLATAMSAIAEDEKWITLFDGKSLDGWEKVGNERSVWEVKEGSINGSGPPSMLVCTKGPYKNFRYRAEVKINDHGNSGLYFRTTRKPGFTDGHEAQINSSHTDPIRTGSKTDTLHSSNMILAARSIFARSKSCHWRTEKNAREGTRLSMARGGCACPDFCNDHASNQGIHILRSPKSSINPLEVYAIRLFRSPTRLRKFKT